MDSRIRKVAARQADLVAEWQLRGLGVSRWTIRYGVRELGWRVVHRGVYALNHAPLTQRQLWIAAVLTAPGSFLSHTSAAICQGIIRPRLMPYETVTRAGKGGKRKHGGVIVWRSTTLDGETTRRDGLPITSGARTLIDQATLQPDRATRRMFREALRLKVTNARELQATLQRHRGRRGTSLIAQLATRYAAVPYARARSDAEAIGLEVLHDAGIEPPLVNVEIAGEEADLTWPRHKLIVEIDGPQYHRFPADDARKQRAWEKAGYRVRRVVSDLPYDQATQFVALVRDELAAAPQP